MAEPRYCNNYTGLCVSAIVGCAKDKDCADTEYCDPSTRACRARKTFCAPCANDGECGGVLDNCLTDTTLNEKFCGSACNVNADCPRGATCQDKGGVKQCWPDKSPIPGLAANCKNFRGCTPDALRTCNKTSDCGDSSQRCDPSKGKCVAVEQVCPFGTVCDPRAKICVSECAADADCGDPKLRCTNRACEAIGECNTDAACPVNKVCAIPFGAMAGQCVAFCQTDTECPLGDACTKIGDKYRCAPGCTSNANCRFDQRCNATTKDCEGPTVGSARICQTNSACASCEVCNLVTNECVSAKAVFPYCAPCSPGSGSTECPGGTCVNLDDGKNYCARFCGQGQDCPQGFVCLGLQNGQQACVPSNRQCVGKCP